MVGEILRAEQITKEYEGRRIIENVSLHLQEREIVSILGTSGVGKTTLFHILSGLKMPEEGRVYLTKTKESGLKTADVQNNTAAAGSRREIYCEKEITGIPGKVSYMLQKDLLLPHKKVIDNAALSLRMRGMKKKEARKAVNRYFAEFGLEGTQYRYPHQLSGGMRQRAALLRTYIASDGVVLLDEPFSALDSITKSKMHAWYMQMKEKMQLSTLLITHDIDEALVLSDRIYIMSGKPGKITKEILVDKKENKAGFYLTQRFLEYKREILKQLEDGKG